MYTKPEFETWTAELDYYALTIREMKHSDYPLEEDLYIRSSRSYLVDEIINVLKYLDSKGLYKEYTKIRNQNR